MKSIKILIAVNLCFIFVLVFGSTANAKAPQDVDKQKAAIKAYEQYIKNGEASLELNNPKVDYIYLDDDNIPECLISSDCMTWLLCYEAGKIDVIYSELYIQEFGYLERSRKFYMAFYPGSELSFMNFEFNKSKELVSNKQLVIGNIMCGEEYNNPTFSMITGVEWEELEVVPLTQEEFKEVFTKEYKNYVNIKTSMYDEYIKELESPLAIVSKF